MCVFCDIVAGSADAHVVLEDTDVIGFLDTRPLFFGHTLIVPRQHYETLPDLPDETLPGFFRAIQELSRALPAATASTGTFIAMNNKVSQSVPHLHAHVVPRRFKDGLKGFFWPRHKYESDAHMAEVAAAIRSELTQT